jgi:hypothetical protein
VAPGGARTASRASTTPLQNALSCVFPAASHAVDLQGSAGWVGVARASSRARGSAVRSGRASFLWRRMA